MKAETEKVNAVLEALVAQGTIEKFSPFAVSPDFPFPSVNFDVCVKELPDLSITFIPFDDYDIGISAYNPKTRKFSTDVCKAELGTAAQALEDVMCDVLDGATRRQLGLLKIRMRKQKY